MYWPSWVVFVISLIGRFGVRFQSGGQCQYQCRCGCGYGYGYGRISKPVSISGSVRKRRNWKKIKRSSKRSRREAEEKQKETRNTIESSSERQ